MCWRWIKSSVALKTLDTFSSDNAWRLETNLGNGNLSQVPCRDFVLHFYTMTLVLIREQGKNFMEYSYIQCICVYRVGRVVSEGYLYFYYIDVQHYLSFALTCSLTRVWSLFYTGYFYYCFFVYFVTKKYKLLSQLTLQHERRFAWHVFKKWASSRDLLGGTKKFVCSK